MKTAFGHPLRCGCWRATWCGGPSAFSQLGALPRATGGIAQTRRLRCTQRELCKIQTALTNGLIFFFFFKKQSS